MGKSRRTAEKIFLTPQSLNAAIKNICDVLRRSNCAGALQYIPELTWMLFLRILDEQETLAAEKANFTQEFFPWSIEAPYRWQDWAAPYQPSLFDGPLQHKPRGWKRVELEQRGGSPILHFINTELFPYLVQLGQRPEATPRQKVIGEIAGNIGQTRIDMEYNLQAVLDKVETISAANIDPTHIFPLSQIYEGLLLKMGHKASDGGQFFTPREVVRVMTKSVAPQPGETIYDPCCGTGGFLAEAYEHMRLLLPAPDFTPVGQFYGREKENLVYPLALANLVLHGIDEPHLWHGNTLTGHKVYDGLWQGAPGQFDVILTNPPFGGKESIRAQERFLYKSSATQVLFLQHIIDSLKPGGRCGVVVDEGVLFRINEIAYVQTKRRLLETCDVDCIVSLPPGAFINAGASVKTNLVFFTKGRPTQSVWYYDLSDVKIGRRRPLLAEDFQEFFQLRPHRVASVRSWSVTRAQIDERGYDLKAANPHYQAQPEDVRSPEDLLLAIEKKNREIDENLRALKSLKS